MKKIFLVLFLIFPLIATAKIRPQTMLSIDTPSDEECMTFESTNNAIEWEDCTEAGSVSSGDIDNGTIAAIDIATGAVGTAEVADNTIAAIDIATGAVGTAEMSDTYCSSVVAASSDPTTYSSS